MASPFLVALLSLLFANFIAGLLPLFLVSVISKCGPSRSKTVTFFMHIGTGSFFATCLLILLPESKLHFESRFNEKESTKLCPDDKEVISEESHTEEFPLPEFILLCGFFATFTVEEAMSCILCNFRKRKDNNDPRVRFCSCAKRHTECSRTFKAHNPDQTLFGLERQNTAANTEESFGFAQRPTEQVNLDKNLLQSSSISQPVPNYGTVTATTDIPKTPLPPTPEVIIENHAKINNLPLSKYKVSNILLLVVLACQAVFQGMGLGPVISSKNFLLLFFLCSQQVIIVFVAGLVGLSNDGNILTVIGFVIVMSVSCPLGITLYIAFDDIMRNFLMFAITKGLLCGSLLYFTFYDLMRRSEMKELRHLYKFVGFTLGASIVTALDYVSTIL